MSEILRDLKNHFHYETFLEVSAAQRQLHVDIEFWQEFRELLRRIDGSVTPGGITSGDIVKIGEPGTLSGGQQELISEAIRKLLPWRKGPFDVFGNFIDAEWRSDIKWSRIRPHLVPATGKIVCDVGCNNGYYLFRLMELEPHLALGLDPNGRFFYQFEFLRKLAGVQHLHFEPLGIEHLHLFPSFFDLVLCMGVVYHRRDPLQGLAALRSCLKPNGQLIFESMAIPGEEPYCLFPEERYGKMRNVWFIPTEGCMHAWLKRSGFVDIERISSDNLSRSEQRRTELAPFESLDDFLDPDDDARTVEGYPAPRRTAYSARRPPQ